nr:structural protein [Tolivirales sp.]
MAKQNKSKRVTVNVVTGKAKPTKKRSKKTNEITAVGHALRYLGGLGGGAAGSYFGNEGLGQMAGTGLGALISKWLGQGSYRVSQNSLVQSARGSGTIPMMHSVAQSVVVRHREYLTPIKGSVAFSAARFFPLQPGDATTFPWLSGLAIKYQQYKIRGMVFHYVPTSGFAVSGTNPALGSVMIQTTYRAGDTPPTSKVEMLNEYWASEASPADPFCHPIECSPKENPFNVHYVRNAPIPDQNSLPLYDIGKTFVATQGMQADNQIVGDLWVTYEIEFSKPQIASNLVLNAESGSVYVLAPLPASVFGTVDTVATGALPFTINTRTITFPTGQLGRFLVVVRVAPAANFSAFDWGVGPTFNSCTQGTYDYMGSFARTNVSGATAVLTNSMCAFVAELTDPSATASIVLTAPTWTGTATATSVLIAQL